MELKIRMSDELYLLVHRAAEHVGKTPAEVLRAAIRGYVNKRPVEQFEIRETCYKPGRMVVTVRKITEPVKADNDLRLFIARRCMEELGKKRQIHRSFAEEAGISHRAPRTIDEALQMECYVED